MGANTEHFAILIQYLKNPNSTELIQRLLLVQKA